MPCDDGGAETGSLRLTDERSADFLPTEAKQNLRFLLTCIFPIRHSIFPTEPDPALRHGKGPVFDGVRGQFVQDEAEILDRFSLQDEVLSLQIDTFGRLRKRTELDLHDMGQRYAGPLLARKRLDRLAKALQAVGYGFLELLHRRILPCQLPHHGLDQREDVLGAVDEFMQDEMRPVLCLAAVER